MNKLSLGHFPTPIQPVHGLDLNPAQHLFVKRDDYSGIEVSGNKIRKLEYCLAEAIDKKYDVIVTTGAIQSNHCRATAAACARLGLSCELLLSGDASGQIEGNLFLDLAFGAKVTFIPPDTKRELFYEQCLTTLKNSGRKPYFIPVGASNALGSHGYRDCFLEILEYEREHGMTFDLIALAVGSGGTYAGLWYENARHNLDKAILGFSVSADSAAFETIIADIVTDMAEQEERSLPVDKSNIRINDLYIGTGYAKSTPEELSFILDTAKKTGILFDPCYTGKAFLGLTSELAAGRLEQYHSILFIHTGGLSGWTVQQMSRALERSEQVS